MVAGALSVASAQLTSSDQVTVFRAELTGPSGTTTAGKLVTVGDRLIFVDDDRPNLSFVLGKADVRRITMEQGALTVDLGRPFTDRFGSRTNLVLRTTEPQHSDAIVRWAGIPLTGGAGASASIRTDEPRDVSATRPLTRTEPVMVEARHDHAVGNCYGRLIVREDGLQFESVGESNHSRGWKYTEIDEIDRNRSENKVVIEPHSGEDFTLKLTGTVDESVFQLITDRIVSNRPRR
jgi:hypothetical protein